MADEKTQETPAENPAAPVDPVPAPDNPDDLGPVPDQGSFSEAARGGKPADYEAAAEEAAADEGGSKRSSKKG